jgi:hypothetical protein
MDSMSEIARLKQQIEWECEAMRLAMIGFRTTASHDIINFSLSSLPALQLKASSCHYFEPNLGFKKLP